MGTGCLGAIALTGLLQSLFVGVAATEGLASHTGHPSALDGSSAALEITQAQETPLEEGMPTPSLPPIQVQTITVDGSSVFNQAELRAVVHPFEGRSLTLAELQQVADAVTQLYLNAGYLTSEAKLVGQNPETGLVQLQVIEGGLEDIRVEGTDRLVAYVQQRIALAGTRPLNQNRLEEQLQLLNADPLFENVEAGLRQGQTAGNSTLIVRVTEAPAVSGILGLDTLSPRSVGQYRTGITLRYNNLAGLGDRLQAAAYRSTSGGSYAYDLSYLVPLNAMNGTLLLRANPDNFRITDRNEPTFALGLSGSTDSYEIQYRQPLIRSLQEELALSAGFRYRQGSTLLLGLITPPTITSVVHFTQDYLRRDPGGAWGVQSQFRLGTGLFNATDLPAPGLNAQFLSWQGRVQRLQILGPDSRLLIQGALQLTPSRLLPGSEQFFIGGAQSVRGYYQNQRFGSNGVQLSVEGQMTLQRDLDGKAITRLLPFLDVGYVWETDPIFQSGLQSGMVGTGLGLEIQPLENLMARMDLGYPLIQLNDLPSDRPTGLRVYFDIRYSF